MNKTFNDFNQGLETDMMLRKSSNGVKVMNCDTMTISVTPRNGGHKDHKLVVQFSSLDENKFYHDTEYVINGTGMIHEINIRSINWVRWRISEIDRSVCDIAMTFSRDSIFC